jgi:hypothetical protein
LFVCLLVGWFADDVGCAFPMVYQYGLRPLALVGAGSQDVILPWIM